MSEYEAERLQDQLERKWNAKHTKRFLTSMERKLSRKEHHGL